MQGIAISSVFGLAVLPIIGFAYEKLLLGAPCDPHCYMPQEAHFAFWCAASAAAYFLDRWVERRGKRDRCAEALRHAYARRRHTYLSDDLYTDLNTLRNFQGGE